MNATRPICKSSDRIGGLAIGRALKASPQSRQGAGHLPLGVPILAQVAHTTVPVACTLRRGVDIFAVGGDTFFLGSRTFRPGAHTLHLGGHTCNQGASTFGNGADTFLKGATTFSLPRPTALPRKSRPINH